jgi:hypothetical protein
VAQRDAARSFSIRRERSTLTSAPVTDTATGEPAPHPAHHVKDRLLPLKQTAARHPLDPPTRFHKRRPSQIGVRRYQGSVSVFACAGQSLLSSLPSDPSPQTSTPSVPSAGGSDQTGIGASSLVPIASTYATSAWTCASRFSRKSAGPRRPSAVGSLVVAQRRFSCLRYPRLLIRGQRSICVDVWPPGEGELVRTLAWIRAGVTKPRAGE